MLRKNKIYFILPFLLIGFAFGGFFLVGNNYVSNKNIYEDLVAPSEKDDNEAYEEYLEKQMQDIICESFPNANISIDITLADLKVEEVEMQYDENTVEAEDIDIIEKMLKQNLGVNQIKKEMVKYEN